MYIAAPSFTYCDLPAINGWPSPRFYGMGSSPATWAVYPSKAATRCPNSVVWAVQLPLIGGLPIKIFTKVVPLTFRIST
ncbi:hypothetical protein B296_00007487 [Ensete ventricosum]|uniref:Uncharacterized protein n=1 Tax=Ensete ventricosum TaxID=4639 RepID=A0A426Y244_ENSVE|nr:hypothetical protein B296_00007487 [Ensete ventricosum]